MTDSKQNMQFEVLCYLGKTLKKQGKDKNGKDYKIWTLSMDSEGGKYPIKFSAFDNGLSNKGVQVAQMEEGKYYSVGYVIQEYQHQVHGNVKSKMALWVKESTKDQSTAGRKQEQPSQKEIYQIPPKETLFDFKNFDQFAKEYNEAMNGNALKNEIHMLGAYILNNNDGSFDELIKRIKESFKKV